MPSAKLLWLTKNCVNVTRLSLPPRVQFHPEELERIVHTMTHLQKLEVCWSENIKSLLEISADLKELIIHLKTEPNALQVDEWMWEGICLPPIINIFASNYWIVLHLFKPLLKYYSALPASEISLYRSAKVPMNFHPRLPVLKFRLGQTDRSPVVKASSNGILDLPIDKMDIVEFNYDDKLMHGIVLSLYIMFGSWYKQLISSFSKLTCVTYLSATRLKLIFPEDLKQIANACPNLQWLDLKCCHHCLQNLDGLQSIVNFCPEL